MKLLRRLRRFESVITALILCSVSVAVAFSQHQSTRPAERITQAVDDNDVVALPGSISRLATVGVDQGPAPDSLEIGRTILVLRPASNGEAALRTLLNDQHNPNSAYYHKWLTSKQYGEEFGVAPADIAKIVAWLGAHGLKVDPVTAGRSLISFSGTHAQFSAAFHTTLHQYKVAGGTYWANATAAAIPSAFAPVIAGFSSLSNYPRAAMHTHPRSIRMNGSSWEMVSKSRPTFTTQDDGQTVAAIGPADLGVIYNLQPLWDAGIDGSGQTIAIVSDSDINPSDVDYFRSAFGLSPKNLSIIYDGEQPGLTQDEGEADLDVEWAGVAAPAASIDLVESATSTTSSGIDAAAAYVVNNNLASILNVSYGECELHLGDAGNQFYSQLWEQAAAQGITVLVAAGDSGSSVCADGASFDLYGFSVSGMASTPDNIALGGTDFSGNYPSLAKYWNSTNDPGTLKSVKSYIPESVWNNSCGNPLILSALQSQGSSDGTVEALCNDPAEQALYLNTAAGSGGASNCTVSDGVTPSTCKGGYAKPSWQSGVPGIPNDQVRDLPDLSLMSGNGLWGSFYVFCESDATADGQCDINNELEGAGGTSFAAPIFAGIMALVQQKTASQQGNANYVLYKMAAAEYADSSLASACQSGNVLSGNTCEFYDVTSGTNAVPCYIGFTDCVSSIPGDTYGLLPGYAAAAGYDQGTGLGTLNAFNLVEGWAAAASEFIPTTTTLTSSGSTNFSYGTALSLGVTVVSSESSRGYPSGDIGITSNNPAPNSAAIATIQLNEGQAQSTVGPLAPGSYQLFAKYEGDSVFAPSQSDGLSVAVSRGSASLSLATTRTALAPGENVTISLIVSGVASGVNPGGTVSFTDNGKLLTDQTLGNGATNSSVPVSVASITIPFTQLQPGANVIQATYSGDTNYLSSTSNTAIVTLIGPFTTTLSTQSLSLSAAGAGDVTVTVSPNGDVPLSPNGIIFSCPVNLPSGLTCAFSAPVATSGGSVTSQLTLQAASPLIQRSSRTNQDPSTKWKNASEFASLAGVFMFAIARRRTRRAICALTVLMVIILNGCAGGANGPGTAQIATTTSISVSPIQPELNQPVALSATVVSSNGMGTPTGEVSFSSGSTHLGSGTLVGGSTTVTTQMLSIGTDSVAAAYSGDTHFAPSTSSASSVGVVFETSIAITASDAEGDSSSANLALTIQ